MLKWMARLLFGASVLAMGWTLWYRRSHPRPAVPPAPLTAQPLRVDWSREPFQEWVSQETGIRLRYPARYDAIRGFGKFTSRDIEGGIVETDLVAFRSAQPRSVIMIATYEAPRPLSWDEWVKLARGPAVGGSGQSAVGSRQQSVVSSQSEVSEGRNSEPGTRNPELGTRNPEPGTPTPPLSHSPTLPLSPAPPSPFPAEFGGSEKRYRFTKVGERPALAVSARSAERYPLRGNERWEMWNLESRLVAEGKRAVRVTAGVLVDHYEAALPGLKETLQSFRWEAPSRPTGQPSR